MFTSLNTIGEEIENSKGIDGFVVFDEDCKPIESSLPAEFLKEDTGHVVRDILSANIQALDDHENTVLLSEKGAWFISKVGTKYLMILGGFDQVVDIPELINLGDKIKAEIIK